jgi:type I restriction enzyme S subunit
MTAVEGWKSKPLSGLLSLIIDFRGKTPKKLGMEWGNGDIPALSASNVGMGRIDFSKECYFGSETLYRKWMTKGDARMGDVVLTTEAPLGNVAQIPDGRRYILSQRTVLLRANDAEVCNDYLRHYLTSEWFQNLMRQQSSGTTATGIQRAKLETLPVNFPVSKPEQAIITGILAMMDRAIEETEVLIAKQRRIKTGLVQELLTRGIDENGNLRSEQDHAFKDSPLGRIPAEWTVKSLEDCVEFWDGKRVPLKQEDRDAMEGDYPYYGASGIIDYINKYLFDEDLILLGEDGENVVSRHLPLAFRVRGKIWVNNHAHVLKPKAGHDIIFLTERLEFYDYTLLVSGSAQPKLNQRNLRRMELPIPGGSEQTRISKVLASLEENWQSRTADLAKLRALKTALMQDLLTGKKRVTPLLELEPAH